MQEAEDKACHPSSSPPLAEAASEGPLTVLQFPFLHFRERSVPFLKMCHPTAEDTLFLLFHNMQNGHNIPEWSRDGILSFCLTRGSSCPGIRGPADWRGWVSKWTDLL